MSGSDERFEGFFLQIRVHQIPGGQGQHAADIADIAAVDRQSIITEPAHQLNRPPSVRF